VIILKLLVYPCVSAPEACSSQNTTVTTEGYKMQTGNKITIQYYYRCRYVIKGNFTKTSQIESWNSFALVTLMR